MTKKPSACGDGDRRLWSDAPSLDTGSWRNPFIGRERADQMLHNKEQVPGVTGSNVDPYVDNAYTEITRGIATAWV